MDFREHEMDFGEADRRYAELEGRVPGGSGGSIGDRAEASSEAKRLRAGSMYAGKAGA